MQKQSIFLVFAYILTINCFIPENDHHFHNPDSNIISFPLTNSKDIRYTGKLFLGSNLQELNVQFDTGSYFLVIPDVSLSEAFTNTFDCQNSLTCEPNFYDQITITYGTSKATGHIIQDQVTLGNSLNMTPEVIVLATDWPRNSQSTIDGIFGLGFERYPEKLMASKGLVGMGYSSYNFVKDLKRQGLIEKSQFAFYLDSNVHPKGFSAQFMIGGYDPKYTKGKMVFLDVVTNNQWAVRLNGIKIGHEKIRISSGNGRALLDSGTSVLTFPHNIYRYIISYIQENTNCKQLKGLMCMCGENELCQLKPSDFPKIEFHFDGVKAVLTGEAYTKMAQDGVFLELMSFETNSEVVILGDTFMRQYLTLFDVDEGRIGLAPSINFREPIRRRRLIDI